MKKLIKPAHGWALILIVIFVSGPSGIRAQNTVTSVNERDTLIKAAKELMEASRYCALITLDSSGHPQVRTMDPFGPSEDMVVWMGTNASSRKVGEIRADSRVSLYYEAPDGSGYVVIQGNAHLTDDPEHTERYWKKEWGEFYPDKDSSFLLIRVIPKKLEIISYSHGISGSSETWAVPFVEFSSDQ